MSLKANASVFPNYSSEYPIYTEQKEAGLLFIERCTVRLIKDLLGTSLVLTKHLIHCRWHYINNGKE